MRRLAVILLLCTAGNLAGGVVTPAKDVRPADQTFLTYPEWFLVFSPAEYADFVRTNTPDDFPFLGHIRQFWQGYDAVWNETRGKYPFNGGYHMMIMVIGASTTGEYAVRSAYETIFGRLAELTRTHGMTDEERYGARVAKEYVDFIRVYPWYEFDFSARLSKLWTSTSVFGPDMIRKWERKWALTSEYSSKAIYGWLIKKATKAAYEDPLPTTAVVTDRGELLMLPRYEAFMPAAIKLADSGVQFREIAGNRDVILISVLVPAGAAATDRLVLRQPIITRPGTERLLLSVPIKSLASTLRRYRNVEHIFDF
jgi:hypothetical protein